MATTGSIIDRGGEPRVLTSFGQHILAHIMCNYLIINLIKSDIIVTIDSCSNVVVGAIETVGDVPDHLIFWNGFPHYSEFRGEPFHLGEVC
jgi:hypothetical protein